MTTSLDRRLPTSITFDPIVRAKYKSNRDYYYNEDPVYRKAVQEQHASYMKNYYTKDPIRLSKLKERIKKYNAIATLSKESYEKAKQYRRERYQKNKEIILIREKENYKTKPRDRGKPKLSDGLELREESS
jgi:hypothetical protein